MGKDVRFSFESLAERNQFEVYAHARGMTLSTMAKVAFYRFVKDREEYNAKRRTGRPAGRPRPGTQESVENPL